RKHFRQHRIISGREFRAVELQKHHTGPAVDYSIWHCSGGPEERNANSWSTFSQTNVYENAEITSKWHHSCFCQRDPLCLLAMYAYQQMTRTPIYNVMR